MIEMMTSFNCLPNQVSENESNKKNYSMNNHVITGGFKSIRKQMYKLYTE